MFQRLGDLGKGFAENLAKDIERQRTAQASLSRSNSGAQASSSRTGSPAKRQGKGRVRAEKEAATKGPDPAEFVLDDDDGSSRAGTPAPGSEKETPSQEQGVGEKPLASEVKEDKGTTPNVTPAPSNLSLPTDVRVRLRKLERLEKKYEDLRQAYGTAHARVLAIGPFETALREHTPLTTIDDPKALVEYLSQISLKGDMVMDELKRVTTDRDDYRKKLEKAEKDAREAWDEVTKIRPERNGTEATRQDRPEISESKQKPSPSLKTDNGSVSEDTKSPTTAANSPASNLVKSLFSPRQKPAEPEPMESEDFFSYDDELPRLQSELRDRDSTISSLRSEVTNLNKDLAVVRESTEGMAQSLEIATRELEASREQCDNLNKDASQGRAELEEKLASAEALVEEAEESRRVEAEALSKMRNLTNFKLEELPEYMRPTAKLLTGLRLQKTELGTQLDALKAEQEARLDALNKQITSSRLRLEKVSEDVLQLASSDTYSSESRLSSVKTYLEYQLEAVRNGSPEHEAMSQALQEAKKLLGEKPDTGIPEPSMQSEEAHELTTTSKSKKKNKKKKKTGQAGQASTDIPATSPEARQEVIISESPKVATDSGRSIQDELQRVRDQLTTATDALRAMREKWEKSTEEVEHLREELTENGQELVVTLELAKNHNSEKAALEAKVQALEADIKRLQTEAAASATEGEESKDLKLKTASLQSSVAAAEQLAATRFKELTDLKALLTKAQPELASLRTEVAALQSAKDEAKRVTADLRNLEAKQEELKSEMSALQRRDMERNVDIKNWKRQVTQETDTRLLAEQANLAAQRDLRKAEKEKNEAIEKTSQASEELAKAKEEVRVYREKTRALDQKVAKLGRETDGLREEIELKAAQHASAQDLMGSMRDQTSEMTLQLKEARERCESLEEELADAHRLLSERSREGETMRRLLADVDSRAEIRIREMRERMETAIDERDRAEDEASTTGRRRAREVEDLKSKVRELERSLKRAEEERGELDRTVKDWQRKREDVESRASHSVQELEELRTAMRELRDALDESEKHARELERQKTELRQSVTDTQGRLEKLQRSSKIMSDEMRTLKSAKTRVLESETSSSSRSSLDGASVAGARKASTSASKDGPNGSGSTASMDFVYLKNVLLQFLEQRDKGHQTQLIPVLGMLLHFDKSDEQRWMAAISTRYK